MRYSAASVRQLRVLYDAGSVAQLSDGQLLKQFAVRRAEATEAHAAAEAAFAALMARHGPMVMGVCRRALPDPQDAEDAFQATFLVLVRKSASVRVDDSLGRWLYGVARRVAARARVAALRRRAREAPPGEDPAARSIPDAERTELTAILDEELARLPERYRLPLVLCYLEGHSNEEAARRMGCPIGTLQSRMARGRERLRARLVRRGLASASAVAWAALPSGSARAEVPAGLADSTLQLATSRAPGVARAAVVALGEGVMRTMTVNRVTAVLGILGVTLVSAAGVLTQSPGVGRPAVRGPEGKATGRPAPGEKKTLAFPVGRSLGVLHVRRPGIHADGWGLAEDPWSGWERLAEATGAVEIPAGREVCLEVNSAACDDLSPLRRLAPEDLAALDFRGAAIRPEALADLAHLSGLRALRFLNCRLDDVGMKPLSGLRSLRTLDLQGTPVGDAGLAHVASLPALSTLGLGRTRVTEKGVAAVARAVSLRSLDLTGDEVGDAALAKLAGAVGLERLTIAHDHYVTDRGLVDLAHLARLKYLDLTGTTVGDAGLRHLSGLHGLEFLRLTDTKVTDAGLAHLEGMKSLKVLLPPAGITDAGLARIGRLAALRHLFVSYSPITDRGLEHLAGLDRLEALTLTGTEARGISDAAVPSIARITGLKKLGLYLTAITDDGLAGLTALKGLEQLDIGGGAITWDGLRNLERFPALRELGLAGVAGRPTLERLRPLKALRRLSINGNERFRSDGDLAHIGGLRALETLSIKGIPITDEGMKRLAGLTALRNASLYDHERVRVGDSGLAAVEGMRRLEYLQITGPITDRGLEHLTRLESLRFLNLGSRMVSDAAIADLKRRIPSLQEVRKTPLRTTGTPPAVGELAPDFETMTFAGEAIRLRELRGRTVLLYYWATWCSPCVAATPQVARLQGQLAERDESFVMISLSLDESDDLARRHAKRHDLRWPQAWIGMDSPVRERYGVLGAPTYVVIGPGGRIASITNEIEAIRPAVEATSK